MMRFQTAVRRLSSQHVAALFRCLLEQLSPEGIVSAGFGALEHLVYRICTVRDRDLRDIFKKLCPGGVKQVAPLLRTSVAMRSIGGVVEHLSAI
jgi:hypothetical protein